jgi:hypothetical protein
VLQVDDLPTPEEVFKVKRIGLEELFFLVLEPLVVGGYWFEGIGWVILVSAVLQTFYNVELTSFTIATGSAGLSML